MDIVTGARLPQPELRRLAQALIVEFGHAYPDWTVEEACAELANDVGLPMSWIALVDDRAVACASLLADDEVVGNEPGPWLGNVWVDPAHRGLGIGGMLVRNALAEAKGRGYDEVFLVTDTAPQWYLGHGWQSVREAAVHGHAMVLMRIGL